MISFFLFYRLRPYFSCKRWYVFFFLTLVPDYIKIYLTDCILKLIENFKKTYFVKNTIYMCIDTLQTSHRRSLSDSLVLEDNDKGFVNVSGNLEEYQEGKFKKNYDSSDF